MNILRLVVEERERKKRNSLNPEFAKLEVIKSKLFIFLKYKFNNLFEYKFKFIFNLNIFHHSISINISTFIILNIIILY